MFNKMLILFQYLRDNHASKPKKKLFEIPKALKGVVMKMSNEDRLEQSSSIVNMQN